MVGIGTGLGPLDKQFLALVSQEVLKQDADGEVDLRQIGMQSAHMLNVDLGGQRRLQHLLGTWTSPRSDARKFIGQLAVDLGVSQLRIDEPQLLSHIGGLEGVGLTSPSGRPDDPEAQLHPAHTAAAWNDSFIRMFRQYRGLEPGVDAREYNFPGGRAMVERLMAIAGIEKGDRVYNPGSGEGGEARHLSRMGVHVTGVDLSDLGCAVALRQNGEQAAELHGKIDIINDDIGRVQLKEKSFDHILAPDCDGIHYTTDRVELFSRWKDSLEPGGTLAISMYLPNEGTPKEVCDAFDENMAWAGLKPTGCNAESYIKALEEAGFTDVEAIPIPDVYQDWNERAYENSQPNPDPWLGKWIDLAKKSPAGFGFILRARRPNDD